MKDQPGNDLIELCARAAHEMNRAWCIFIGDNSQKPWDEAPDWQKVSCRDGVLGVLAGNTPEQSHENWLRHKQANGWVYGPTKNEANKTHPAMMPYGDLPLEQKIKDQIYRDAVLAMSKAYGNHPQ
jgi:hypothetical protein